MDMPRKPQVGPVPTCDVCLDPLVEPEDIEEGVHFLCGDFGPDEDEADEMADDPEYFDEGGESG